MIERLLAAEGALARDELDHAERLYGQVAEADPRNAIALVGLARVAARRGDTEDARGHAERALEIDPEEAAARRLLIELSMPAVTPAVAPVEAPLMAPRVEPAVRRPEPAAPRGARAAPPRRSLLDRLLGWLGLRPRS